MLLASGVSDISCLPKVLLLPFVELIVCLWVHLTAFMQGHSVLLAIDHFVCNTEITGIEFLKWHS